MCRTPPLVLLAASVALSSRSALAQSRTAEFCAAVPPGTGSLGRSDAHSGTPAFSGGQAPGLPPNLGSVYAFALAPTAEQYGSCAAAAPCNNFDAHAGCANSTGQGAILAACGSGSVALDEIPLEATHLPPTTSAILFLGGGQGVVPLGDGLRFVTPGSTSLYRFGLHSADTNGFLRHGPGLVAASQALGGGAIQAGRTWNLQLWYRNPSGPCGQFTNLTNGVEIAVVP